MLTGRFCVCMIVQISMDGDSGLAQNRFGIDFESRVHCGAEKPVCRRLAQCSEAHRMRGLGADDGVAQSLAGDEEVTPL